MNENAIKKAFDEIEPEAGAQERMYANILKKTSAQRAASENNAGTSSASVPLPARRPTPLWKRFGAMAACLALVTVLTLGFLHPFFAGNSEGDEPPVMTGSPFEDVQSAAAFAKLGFTIDAPEGVEDVSYCILDGEIAQVTFTLDGHSYTYRASMLDGNFSGDTEEAVGSASLNAEYDAVLDRLSPTGWRAHWSRDAVNCYLTNFDGAGEEAITALVNELLG